MHNLDLYNEPQSNLNMPTGNQYMSFNLTAIVRFSISVTVFVGEIHSRNVHDLDLTFRIGHGQM